MSDKWDLKLDEEVLKIQECQKSHTVSSCSKCELWSQCELRKIYIKAAYSSMNKGSSGGFEF
jgi:hypothetical protein